MSSAEVVSVLLFVTGTGVILCVLYDFFRSTISLSGLGPLSSLTASVLWRTARRVEPWCERRLGLRYRRLIGPAILSAVAGSWIILHLAGYVLLYAAGPSLTKSDTGAPADLIETIAFAGSALSTLGASIVEPTNGWWDALSMIAAINGMVVLTLSVSFILNILQTTTAARALAARYNALNSSQDGSDSRQELARIAPLGSDLCEVALKLKGSPLPGFFVPDDPGLSFAAAVERMCDLLDEEERAPSPDADFDIAEIRLGIALLGRHVGAGAEEGEVEAARSWARARRWPT